MKLLGDLWLMLSARTRTWLAAGGGMILGAVAMLVAIVCETPKDKTK